MGAYKERCSRGCPCVFCGDIGLDMRMHYPESDRVVHWCHKTEAAQGDIVRANDGKEYICISAAKTTTYDSMGSFQLFVEYVSKEEWIENQRRRNPNWKPGDGRPRGAARTYQASEELSSVRPEGEGELLPGEAKVLDPVELDRRYRALLDELVLEDWHKKSLLKDWKGEVHDVSNLLDRYPIRSLPPEDRERFSELGRRTFYRNPSRKKLMASLWEKFGPGLEGTPGFYRRDTEYYRDKPESERWTIAARTGGIIFPVYDKDGLIYRIRLKVDHPDLVIKEKYGDKPYRGSYGYFTWQMAEDGLRTYYVADGSSFADRVEVPENDAHGKPRGKYVNFSSFLDRPVDGVVRNVLTKGCQSGSPYGLYGVGCDNETTVILTEGEKKAMVAAELMGCRAVSIPGVSSFNVIFREEHDGKSLFDSLLETGAETFVLCYDADKESNDSVLQNEQHFAQALTDRGATVLIGSWSSKYDKGLDDLLLLGISPTIKRYKPPKKADET